MANSQDLPDHPSAPRLLHDLLTEAAWRTPAASAVRDTKGSWNYQELARHSMRFSTWLGSHGVVRGDRVLVHHERTRHVLAMLYGTSLAGAVFVPVEPTVGDLRLSALIEHAEPAVVITSDAGALAGSGITSRQARVFQRDEVWEEVATTTPVPGGPIVGDDDLALLIYTSGSTSSPKAVMCSHRQVVFAAGAVAAGLGYRPDDAVFCRLPFSFDYGLYQALLCAIGGSELQLWPAGHDVELLRAIRDWRCTVVPLVPSLAAMIVKLAGRNTDKVTRVRLVTNTGEVLRPELASALRAALPGVRISPMFGVTECKRISIMEPDGDKARPGSVGRPLAGTEVLVVDSSGRPQPPGEVGEFVVRGPHVAAGYWRAPELTATRFRSRSDGPPELHTGDFGYQDPDGYLYFVGRRDDIFKRRGVRMSVAEIEAAATEVAGVTAAVVIRPDDHFDMILFVVGRSNHTDVLRQLRRRLEPAKVPAACVVLPALPLTQNGKADRRRLATMRTVRG